MGPDPPPPPPPDPALQKIKEQAESDRVTAMQERLSRETRDNLIRFGRAKALSGAGSLGGGLGVQPLG